ncbi:MAG: hypothetical protein EXQ51_05190 [Acidobacteria bacterium]|nr:hypothetical protein [Acidobacteriota bacterium]
MFATSVVLALAIGGAGQDRPADGAMISVQPCAASTTGYDDYVSFLGSRPAADPKDTPFDAATLRRNHPQVWFEALRQGERVRCRRISYGSDGLAVTGFIVEPSADAPFTGPRPLVVFNRGGNQAFGSIRTADLMEFAGWALDGYVVVATQYQGNDGGQGREEFGGSEVADVLNVLAVGRALPNVDADRTYMYGMSRGGMMTCLALKHGARVSAAAVIGAPADLEEGLRYRPQMEEVYRELMPGYAERKASLLKERSAIAWPKRLSAPLLILHGRADWRVWPGDSLAVAAGLQRRGRLYELTVYAGDDHPLTRSLPEVRTRLRAWFAAH